MDSLRRLSSGPVHVANETPLGMVAGCYNDCGHGSAGCPVMPPVFKGVSVQRLKVFSTPYDGSNAPKYTKSGTLGAEYAVARSPLGSATDTILTRFRTRY